jgi:ketosteroid isomerase-like protein
MFELAIIDHHGDETEAVLAVVDALFLAYAAGDADRMDELVLSDATSFRLFRDESGWTYQRLFEADFNHGFRDGSSSPFEERIWNPEVDIRGALASVWAPFEIRVDGAVIRCGYDQINLIRIDEEWRISSFHWIEEADTCDELYPEDMSAMRPEFPETED